MLNLLLHHIIYGLFEVYLFFGYWFLRITFLDRFAERLIIHLCTKGRIRINRAYLKTANEGQELDTMVDENDTDDKWPTITILDRRSFAKMAVYPTLGVGEAFLVSKVPRISYSF